MARTPRSHTRTRSDPRISANALAEYMVSSETGKLGIIRSARESGTAQRTRYKDARDATKAYLTDPNRDLEIIDAARELLEQQSGDASLSAFRRDDAEKSDTALEALVRMRNEVGGYNYESAPRRQAKLVLAGVQVSVNVDLLITRTYRGVEQVGGALFRYTMPGDETDAAQAKRRDRGMYAATLVHMQVVEHLAGNKDPNHNLCMAVDVQHGQKFLAPRTYAQRAQNLENACRFIAALWDTA